MARSSLDLLGGAADRERQPRRVRGRRQLVCARLGCGQVFAAPARGKVGEADDASLPQDCVYHPGPPVFHDGCRSWSCCMQSADDFEAFMALPGCARAAHTARAQPAARALPWSQEYQKSLPAPFDHADRRAIEAAFPARRAALTAAGGGGGGQTRSSEVAGGDAGPGGGDGTQGVDARMPRECRG